MIPAESRDAGYIVASGTREAESPSHLEGWRNLVNRHPCSATWIATVTDTHPLPLQRERGILPATCCSLGLGDGVGEGGSGLILCKPRIYEVCLSSLQCGLGIEHVQEDPHTGPVSAMSEAFPCLCIRNFSLRCNNPLLSRLDVQVRLRDIRSDSKLAGAKLSLGDRQCTPGLFDLSRCEA